MVAARGGVARDSAHLAGGAVAAGLLAYAFVLIGTRGLGTDEFGPVSLLWSYWLVVSAAITVPLQQWLVHAATVGTTRGEVHRLVRRVVAASMVVSAIELVVLVATRDAIFDDTSLVFPGAFAAMTFGSAVLGITRGRQAVRGHYRWVAMSVAGENGIRVAGAAVGVVAGLEAEFFALLMPVGLLVAFMPPAALLGPLPDVHDQRRGDASSIVAIAGSSILAQLLWSAGPFVVALQDGPPAAVTGIFLLLSLARIPYLIAYVIGLRALEWMSVPGRLLRRIRLGLLAAAVVASPVVGAVGGAIGPAVVRVVFGDNGGIRGLDAALIAAGGVVALMVLFLSLSLIAGGRAWSSLAAGVVAALAGIVVTLTGVSVPTTTAAVAFLAAEVAYLIGVGAAVWRAPDTVHGRPPV